MTSRSAILLMIVIVGILMAAFIAAGCDSPTSPTPVGVDITCPDGRKASEVSQIPCQVCVVCKVG